MTDAYAVEALHPEIGSAVTGIDLAAPLAPTTVEAFARLWAERLVLVFPGQPITDAQQVAFARSFGALELHPSIAHRLSTQPEIYRVSNIAEDGGFIPPKNETWRYVSQSWRWHSDSSFRAVPSKGSILHGIETTNEGGDTSFANLSAAYDALDPATKQRIERLRVVHDHDFILQLTDEEKPRGKQNAYDAMPPVSHPLVQVHPVTGRRGLFLSPHTMARVEGMADAEGRALLDDLIAHATQDRFVYRHRWSDHDVLMWDNRCTMHAVEPFDNARIRRVMHRVTLAGEAAPIAAA